MYELAVNGQKYPEINGQKYPEINFHPFYYVFSKLFALFCCEAAGDVKKGKAVDAAVWAKAFSNGGLVGCYGWMFMDVYG